MSLPRDRQVAVSEANELLHQLELTKMKYNNAVASAKKITNSQDSFFKSIKNLESEIEGMTQKIQDYDKVIGQEINPNSPSFILDRKI